MTLPQDTSDRLDTLIELLTKFVSRSTDRTFLGLVEKCEYTEFTLSPLTTTFTQFVPADPQRWCLVFSNISGVYSVGPVIGNFHPTSGLPETGMGFAITPSVEPVILSYPDTLQLCQLAWGAGSNAANVRAGAFAIRWKG
jgi:hypothetical protein